MTDLTKTAYMRGESTFGALEYLTGVYGSEKIEFTDNRKTDHIDIKFYIPTTLKKVKKRARL